MWSRISTGRVLLCVVFLAGTTWGDSLVIYKLNSGAGTVAVDSAGNGHDGVINGAEWQPGGFNGKGYALSFQGGTTVEDADAGDYLNGLDATTVAIWIKSNATNSDRGFVTGVPPAGQDRVFTMRYDSSGASFGGTSLVKMGIQSTGGDQQIESSSNIQTTEWQHLAMTWESGGEIRFYVNGVEDEVAGRNNPNNTGETSEITTLIIGKGGKDASNGWDGLIDEVRIFDTALTAEEIQQIMTGNDNATAARAPQPDDAATDILPEPTLSWEPGDFAVEHDVYLGTDLDDVNNATTADAAYVGRQAETSYDPGALTLGQAYFWRIDEVNAAPDNTVFKGAVWNFTVEPVSFVVPTAAVSATASSTSAPQDPNNTVNGVGLNEDDEHTNILDDMWASGDGDPTPWIQFEFAQLEKLDKARVWNHNSQTESVLGFGIKEALVEFSTDGETWSELGTVEIPQAPGSSSYTGVELELGGIVAKYLKVTALSNYSVLGLPQKGLAEVRFYAMPMRARLESPASGSTGLDPLVELNWRAGRDAAQHDIMIGTDPDALTALATVDEASYTAALDLDSTLYWRVNEINDAMDPAAWEGHLWEIATAEYMTVDDMESYQSTEGSYVWETWIDGFGDDNNGALLGHNGDDMETDIVYDGSQSLPYYYGQEGAATSEAFRDIERDWGQHGIMSLSLMFYGDTSNLAGEMVIKVNDQEIATYPTPSDLTVPQWQAWTIDLPASALGNVKSLAIGINGGTGLVLIDAIRLYARASETIDPVVPDDAALVAHYPLDNNANDSSGNALDGSIVNGQLVSPGKVGSSALQIDGSGYVDLGNPALLDFGTGDWAITAWAKTFMTGTSESERGTLYGNGGDSGGGHRIALILSEANEGAISLVCDDDATKEQAHSTRMINDDEWHSVLGQREGTSIQVYIDGRLDASNAVEADYDLAGTSQHNAYLGAVTNNGTGDLYKLFNGLIDDVRIYNRAMTPAEALGLSGRTDPMFKEF